MCSPPPGATQDQKSPGQLGLKEIHNSSKILPLDFEEKNGSSEILTKLSGCFS